MMTSYLFTKNLQIDFIRYLQITSTSLLLESAHFLAGKVDGDLAGKFGGGCLEEVCSRANVRHFIHAVDAIAHEQTAQQVRRRQHTSHHTVLREDFIDAFFNYGKNFVYLYISRGFHIYISSHLQIDSSIDFRRGKRHLFPAISHCHRHRDNKAKSYQPNSNILCILI